MAKQNNTIFWIIGIIIFLLVLTQLPLLPQFTIDRPEDIDIEIVIKEFCEMTGGIYNKIEETCTLPDGTICDTFDYWEGYCGNQKN